MTYSIVLQINSAGFAWRSVQQFFQRWRFAEALLPYFFFLDVSWTLSSYRIHVQVRHWRRIDDNDVLRGFTRRKTAEEILQLAVFDKMNWPPRAEDILLSWFSTELSRRQLCYSSSASTRDFLDGFLPLEPPVRTVSPRNQPWISSHIQDTSRFSRLSRTWGCSRSLHWMPFASYTIGHSLDPKDRAGKWENVKSAKYHRTLPEAQWLLVFDFVHRNRSSRFVDFYNYGGW